MRSTRVEPVLLSRVQGLLFSAKVNHLIKCAFYTNTPLKRPKTRDYSEYLSLIVCRVAILLLISASWLRTKTATPWNFNRVFLRFASDRDEPLLLQTARIDVKWIVRICLSSYTGHTVTRSQLSHNINSAIDGARRHGYCSPDLSTFDELCDAADDELFSKTVRLSHHVLHTLLPPPSSPPHHRTIISDTAPTHWNCLHTPHT